MSNVTLNSFLSFEEEKFDYVLSSAQENLLPTEQDIEFFHEHGWYVSPKVIDEQVIDDLFDASEELYQGIKDAEFPFSGCANWQLGDVSGVRNNEYISLQKIAFRQVSLSPLVGAIAAKLMDTREVRYFQDQLVSKEPSSTAQTTAQTKVGWHTDRSYHSNCTSGKLLTVWIPLHDVTPEDGSLVMIDKSHKWLEEHHLRGFNHDNHQEIKQKFIQQSKRFNPIPLTLKKGQISFHHSALIHGSYQNCSNRMRRAIVLNLQDGENRYQNFWNNGHQIHHFLDDFCRTQANGLPDYRDPAIFPVIWSEKSPNNTYVR